MAACERSINLPSSDQFLALLLKREEIRLALTLWQILTRTFEPPSLLLCCALRPDDVEAWR